MRRAPGAELAPPFFEPRSPAAKQRAADDRATVQRSPKCRRARQAARLGSATPGGRAAAEHGGVQRHVVRATLNGERWQPGSLTVCHCCVPAHPVQRRRARAACMMAAPGGGASRRRRDPACCKPLAALFVSSSSALGLVELFSSAAGPLAAHAASQPLVHRAQHAPAGPQAAMKRRGPPPRREPRHEEDSEEEPEQAPSGKRQRMQPHYGTDSDEGDSQTDSELGSSSDEVRGGGGGGGACSFAKGACAERDGPGARLPWTLCCAYPTAHS